MGYSNSCCDRTANRSVVRTHIRCCLSFSGQSGSWSNRELRSSFWSTESHRISRNQPMMIRTFGIRGHASLNITIVNSGQSFLFSRLLDSPVDVWAMLLITGKFDIFLEGSAGLNIAMQMRGVELQTYAWWCRSVCSSVVDLEEWETEVVIRFDGPGFKTAKSGGAERDRWKKGDSILNFYLLLLSLIKHLPISCLLFQQVIFPNNPIQLLNGLLNITLSGSSKKKRRVTIWLKTYEIPNCSK